MRNNIVHSGAGELTYEIREIVAVAEKFEKLGVKISWENIGDPVAKGEKIPDWLKDIIKKALDNDKNFGYCPTKGLLSTREYIAKLCNNKKGAQITAEDILFFNGLGDAIAKLYTYLKKEARVIGPSPAYSTHSSAEASHAGSAHITYNLLPHKNWLPDIADLENKVRYNPTISGILIINPDNPTGMVYPKKILKQIVAIAKKYDLFIISDEIYANINYGKEKMVSLTEVINDVPGIAMRGISKELPWPGARCGWIEVYNKDKDAVFAKYIKSILDAKMLEVCATTLPQVVIPEIMQHQNYKKHIQNRNQQYAKRADIAYEILKQNPYILTSKPNGAFYMSVVFKDNVLKNNQILKIENKGVKKLTEKISQNISTDKRFAYYLMASTGICIVPLSGFNCDLKGFRITLLESDPVKFKWIFETISEKIKEYCK
jgi:aspartate/methionine/tyrosine aminotransferase